MTKSILLIGNGPSTRLLASVGFNRLPKDLDTFGMGAAYRFYREVRWWPNFYAWCDKKVCFSHFVGLGQIVEDASTDSTKFFFSLPVSQSPKLTVVPHSSTGDFCFREAVRRGYKRIYMIGIEADYVAAIPESRGLTEDEWRAYGSGMLDDLPEAYRTTIRVITETPKRNPNYFFEGYQRAGDHYTLAAAAGHLRSWDSCARLAKSHGTEVINLSPISAIPHFRKQPLRTLWKKTDILRQMRLQVASLKERLGGSLAPITPPGLEIG